VANISTAYLYPATGVIATSDRIEVHGDAGVAIVDLSVPTLTVHAQATTYPDWQIEAPDGSGAFGAQIAHFLECVRRGRPSDIVSIDDALEGIRIADAIVRSAAADGADIWLTPRMVDATAD
jgi:predicted dehydrogenase